MSLALAWGCKCVPILDKFEMQRVLHWNAICFHVFLPDFLRDIFDMLIIYWFPRVSLIFLCVCYWCDPDPDRIDGTFEGRKKNMREKKHKYGNACYQTREFVYFSYFFCCYGVWCRGVQCEIVCKCTTYGVRDYGGWIENVSSSRLDDDVRNKHERTSRKPFNCIAGLFELYLASSVTYKR